MTDAEASLVVPPLAGYRVLRSLARDGDVETVLGFRDTASASATEADDRDRLVTIMVRPATAEAWHALTIWVAALHRAAGDHVIRLIDVDAAAGPTGDVICVVFERLSRGALRDLLQHRARLQAGEAVTILAPLAQTVARMHASGVAHGAISVHTVAFRDDGAPALTDFRSATLFAAEAPEVVREREEGVVADRRALRQLAATVLTRVEGSRQRAARGLLESLEAAPDELVISVLSDTIFEVAAALPLSFEPDAAPQPVAAARAVPIGTIPPLPDPDGLAPRSIVTRLLARVDAGSWPSQLLGSEVARALEGARGWVGSLPPRRRRIMIAALAAAVTVLVAVAAIPSGPPRAEPDAAAGGIISSTPETTPTASHSAAPDDPVAAARLLIQGRQRCLRSLSIVCLEDVDAAGSGALRDDRDRIRAAQQGGELVDPLGGVSERMTPELVERLGDSALVRLVDVGMSGAPTVTGAEREPASLLVVKSEAGWRIRDVIAAGGSAEPTAGRD